MAFSRGKQTFDVRLGLPDALRSLSLPEDTVVVVSYASTDPDQHGHAHVVLDTPLTPEAFLAEAAACFEQGGWVRHEPTLHRSLFVDATKPQFYPAGWHVPSFRKDGWDLRVEVMDDKTEAGLTDARLTYEQVSVFDLAETGGLHDLLPQLRLPEGIKLKGWGGGWYRDTANGSATFSTGRSAVELTEHLTAQLEAAGWQVRERLGSELAALVTLEHGDQDGAYDVRLTVFTTPGSYVQHVSVDATRRGQRSRSHVVFANPE